MPDLENVSPHVVEFHDALAFAFSQAGRTLLEASSVHEGSVDVLSCLVSSAGAAGKTIVLADPSEQVMTILHRAGLEVCPQTGVLSNS